MFRSDAFVNRVPLRAAAVVALAFLFSVSARPSAAQLSRTAGMDVSDSNVVRAVPLTGSIRIDGVPDEPAWQAAQPVTAFTQRVPEEGQPASERTEIRVLVGPDALYIGARLFDSEPDLIRAALVRRDVV